MRQRAILPEKFQAIPLVRLCTITVKPFSKFSLKLQILDALISLQIVLALLEGQKVLKYKHIM